MGPIYDIGYLRAMLLTGSVLVTFGLMMTSISDQYWHFILSQSVVTGLGMTCLFVPSVALVPAYFARRRALAMGIAASGSSVGRLSSRHSTICEIADLTRSYHLHHHLRAAAASGRIRLGDTRDSLCVLSSPCLTRSCTAEAYSSQPEKSSDRSSGAERGAFPSHASCHVPGLSGIVHPLFLHPGLCCSRAYHATAAVVSSSISDRLHERGFILWSTGESNPPRELQCLKTAIDAAANLPQLPNVLADRIGCFNTIVPITFITSVIAFTWISVMSTGNLIAFCFFYGFFSGSFVALVPVVWAALCPNMKLLGTRTGMSTVAMAIGLLVGNPIAGALLDDTDSGVLRLQVFCGATIAAAGIFLTASRLAKTGLQWRIKA